VVVAADVDCGYFWHIVVIADIIYLISMYLSAWQAVI